MLLLDVKYLKIRRGMNMLLPRDINPELSVYYNGSIILKELLKENNVDIINLYKSVKNTSNMSLSTYMLSLDWLFLSDIAVVNESGEVKLCS
ncbi:ABC-three component system middle component 6 [Priestia endophytica]|uniref:ABC-three component system middle component 6 n=1 Tax=Priestia endophytica TaxID=135735 RepID=UPI0029901EE6|nr:ABC-three component system middle component 6 [Priestia endophytica]